MQRAPLKDIQGDTMSSKLIVKQGFQKQTPDKYRDQAATTAAAKLLNSAKKSLKKQCSKRMKLSLQKTSSSSTGSKSSARALAFGTSCDLNDTVEFQDGMSMKTVPKMQLATRKRKNAFQDNGDNQAKAIKYQSLVTETDQHQHQGNELKQTTSTNLYVDSKNPTTRTYSTQKIVIGESHQSPLSEVQEAECVRHSDKETDLQSEMESQSEKRLSASQHTCPACGKVLPRGKFVCHIQMCVRQHCKDEDQFIDSKGETADDVSCPEVTVKLEQRKSFESDTNGLPSEYVFCQLCQKDLSHLNSYRRVLHINKCMDQEEKKKEETEERQRALEAAKTQVLDCPMCGKVLRTAASRKSHLKKCAASLGVEPEQLLAAVKRQEEEHLATLAAGILPSRPGRSSRQNLTGTRKGIGALPKSKWDEDTQLALALSSSLHPDTEEAEPSASGQAKTGKKGRKNKQEEDCLLLKLTQNQAAGRIEARVSDFIMMQAEEEEENVPPLPPFNQQSFHEQTTYTVQWSVNEAPEQSEMFWRLSSLDDQCGDMECGSSDPWQYYVSALMPPVQVRTVVAGSKIRRMSEIPGRCRSQEASARTEKECPYQQEDDHEDGPLPPFSTQTAELLADMAAEADGMDQLTQLSSPHLKDVEQQVHHDLLSAFSSLVNQQNFSDLVIRTAESTSLYAHRIILSVRCPALLQLVDKGSGVIDLTDWSPHCVMAMLKFLYAGETNVDQVWLPQTLQLAQRFGLTLLTKLLRRQLETLTAPDRISGTEEEGHQPAFSKGISTSAMNKHQKPDPENDDRNEVSDCSDAVCADSEENGPPALENCYFSNSPPDVDYIGDVDQKKSEIFDSKHHADCLLTSLTQAEVGPKDTWSQSKTRTVVEDLHTVAPQKVLKSKQNSDLNFFKQKENKLTDDSVKGKASITDATGKHVSKNFETQMTDSVKEAFVALYKDGSVVRETPFCSALSHTEAVTGQLTDNASQRNKSATVIASSEMGDNNFLPSKTQKGYKCQVVSTNVEMHSKVKVRKGNIQNEDLTLAEQSGTSLPQDTTLPQFSECTESMEVSDDDDLFSSDEFDVSVLPSTPQKCQSSASQSIGQNSKQRKRTVIIPEGHVENVEAGGELSSVPLHGVSAEKSAQSQKREKANVESYSVADTSEKSKTRITSSLIVDQSIEQQRWQHSAVENSPISVGVSVIEYSHQHPSLSSPQCRNFKTSSPEVCFENGQIPRNVNKVKLKDKRDLTECDDTPVIAKPRTTKSKAATLLQSKSVTNMKEAGLDINSVNENKQTSYTSVVEQDSLYITPGVKQSETRRTFQLVTPLTSQIQPSSSFRTSFPVHAPRMSHSMGTDSDSSVHAPRISCSVETDSDSSTDVHKEIKQLPQRTDDGDHLEEPICSKNSTLQLKAKEAEDLFLDSDSDLEIVDTSLQDVPSPRFSQSRQRSSQSQSQPVSKNSHLSQSGSQSEFSSPESRQPKLTKLPRSLAVSHHQQFHCQTEHSNSPETGRSPAKSSPSSSLKGFSQRSAESDKELLRVTDLVCGQEDQHISQPQTGGKGDTELPCDVADRTGPSEEDVWDNLDDDIPDIYVDFDPEIDPPSHNVNPEHRKTPSPHCSPKSFTRLSSKSTPVQDSASPSKSLKRSKETLVKMSPLKSSMSSDPIEKSPVKPSMSSDPIEKSPVKPSMSSDPIEKSPVKPSMSSDPIGRSPKRQSSCDKAFKVQKTPVKVKSIVPDTTPVSRAACNKFPERIMDAEENAQLDDSINASGFIFVDEDVMEAPYSSFLWSEENAPTEESVLGQRDNFRQSDPDSGYEKRELTQNTQGLLAQTPTVPKQTRKKRKATRVPPSPFTPMPPYDTMTTPDLKSEVQKFGLKPVGKKRMKLVLNDIYHKTHQYETDSDYEEESHLPDLGPPMLSRKAKQDGQTKQPPVLHKQSKSSRPRDGADKAVPLPLLHKQQKQRNLYASGPSRELPVPAREPARGIEKEPPVVAKEGVPSKPVHRPKTKRGLAQETKETVKAPGTKRGQQKPQETITASQQEFLIHPLYGSPSKCMEKHGGNRKIAHVGSPTKSVADDSSSPEKGFLSQDSDASERPDVSILEEGRLDSDEDDEEITPSQQLAARDLPQRLMAFIQNHPVLYPKVLKYEPLDLGVVKEDLKAAGIKCSQEKLLDFLDEKCITFTTKNVISPKKRNRGRKVQSRRPAASRK